MIYSYKSGQALFLCHSSQVSEGNVLTMAYRLPRHLTPLIPSLTCTSTWPAAATQVCACPRHPLHWPFSDLEGSFSVVRSLPCSRLCPLLTLFPDSILCVCCLSPLLECLLPEDHSFVSDTGGPRCLARSRCSVNIC